MLANFAIRSACGFIGIAFMASNVLGHGGGGDIALFETDGQVDVGFAVLDDDDITQIEFDPDDHVLQAVFTPLPASPLLYSWEIGASEPGFDANEGELPGGAEITFNTVSIRYWDGVGGVDFKRAFSVEGGYSPQPWNAETDGGFHAHPFFGLSDLTDDGMPIADGVYLTELTVSVEGLEDSESFYLVGLVTEQLNPIYEAEGFEPATDAAATLGEDTRAFLEDPSAGAPTLGGVDFSYYGAAIQYAESIPEPSSAAILAAALGLAGWRRR